MRTSTNHANRTIVSSSEVGDELKKEDNWRTLYDVSNNLASNDTRPPQLNAGDGSSKHKGKKYITPPVLTRDVSFSKPKRDQRPINTQDKSL